MTDSVATAEELRGALAQGAPSIRLAPGEYAGPFTIERAVRLHGEPGVVLVGGRANRTLSIAAGGNAVVEGIELRATDQAYMAVCVERDGVATFTRCALRGGDGDSGFATAISSWGVLRIESCRLDGGLGSGATGISAFGHSTIVDNDIEASHIGVNCYGATLTRNRIRAGTYGIYIQGDHVTVRDNVITLAPLQRNARGIFVVSGERHVFERNTIIGGPDTKRWAGLRPRSWCFDEVSDREYRAITITANGLLYHGEVDGPSGGGYTGPTQDFDDFLEHEPVEDLPATLRDEIRAYLRAHAG